MWSFLFKNRHNKTAGDFVPAAFRAGMVIFLWLVRPVRLCI